MKARTNLLQGAVLVPACVLLLLGNAWLVGFRSQSGRVVVAGIVLEAVLWLFLAVLFVWSVVAAAASTDRAAILWLSTTTLLLVVAGNHLSFVQIGVATIAGPAAESAIAWTGWLFQNVVIPCVLLVAAFKWLWSGDRASWRWSDWLTMNVVCLALFASSFLTSEGHSFRRVDAGVEFALRLTLFAILPAVCWCWALLLCVRGGWKRAATR